MSLVIFVGSVASGKTSLARALKNVLANKGFITKYVNININHGFTYLLTRFLAALLRYTYVGNYYLTIRFNNAALFCRYLRLMQILDMIYMPIKYFISIKSFMMLDRFGKRKRRYVILIDEHYLNAIADYFYFSEHLCKCSCAKRTFRAFYGLAYRLIFRSIKKNKALIVSMDISSEASVGRWLCREKTNTVDLNHIICRRLVTKVLLNNFKQIISNNLFKEYLVQDPSESFRNITREVLNFICGRN